MPVPSGTASLQDIQDEFDEDEEVCGAKLKGFTSSRKTVLTYAPEAPFGVSPCLLMEFEVSEPTSNLSAALPFLLRAEIGCLGSP